MLELLNNDKIIWGVTMLLMNIGSKYIMGDISEVSEKIMKNEIVKKLVIFSMFFVATRDMLYAFLLTVGYVIVVDGILRYNFEESVNYKNYLNNIQSIVFNESLRSM